MCSSMVGRRGKAKLEAGQLDFPGLAQAGAAGLILPAGATKEPLSEFSQNFDNLF